ncbi:bleomycin hydrolase [Naganishia albida]|nr:bleomycin hydrolase [Naganishia albida]
MGQQPSKPTNTPSHSQVRFDEKRTSTQTSSQSISDDRIAAYSKSGKGSAGLALDKLVSWQRQFDESPVLQLSQLVLSNAHPTQGLVSRTTLVADQQIFNLELKGVKPKEGSKGVYPGPVTNQKASGRCWLFATTNCLRYRIISHLNLGDFQLSQSYLFFYDKLEKANWYLENILELSDEPLDARIITFLNEAPVNDGGQFDMAVNILEKYGCLPQTLYPESFSSSSSAALDSLLTSKLREFSLELRKLMKAMAARGFDNHQVLQASRARKEEMIKQVFDVLCITLGTPPKADDEFLWEYYDRDGKFCKLKTTPKNFYNKYTGPHLARDCFSLINDPRNAYDTLYTVDRLGNVHGGLSVRYVNAPTEALEDAVIACIKADQPVFFGSDVGASLIRDKGILDTKAYEYERAYGFKLNMNKAQRLQTGDSVANHAMVITAVHVDEHGRPVRYKIENSWSDAAGEKGFFLMTAEWFREFVYQVVIPKKLAESRYVKILEENHARVLPAWDPMGTLA